MANFNDKQYKASVDSVANQMAVIGYVKLHRVGKYLLSADVSAEVYSEISQLILDLKVQVWQDIDCTVVEAALDFLCSSSWSVV